MASSKLEAATTEEKKLMVAAIDFGTTYSGWAFSFTHDFKSNPTKVSCKSWNSGKHVSLKAPTTVLVNPDGVTMEAFGYDAEQRYADLTDEGEHHSYYYFQHFKMLLYDNKTLTRNEELEDDKGKRLPAKRVFSMVIKYLKEDVLEESGKKICGGSVGEDTIRWILTVPAIWNPLAKLFMRECAVEAGIKSKNLHIALEPEAASLYCKYLSIEKNQEKSDATGALSSFQPGSRYMVVDAGGGTIDIIVHEVSDDGTLKEIFKANGGYWGGTIVDKEFLDFLSHIVGQDVMERFKDDHRDDYLDLQREFDVKKRSISPAMTSKVKLKIPVSLTELYKVVKGQTIMKRIQEDKTLQGKIDFKADKVLLDSKLLKDLFEVCTKKIVAHLQTILRDTSTEGAKTILMVGGFSESPMLFEAVRVALPKHHVLLPEDAGLSVLKGAVIYGHNQDGISVRISPYTYGFKKYATFDPNIHPVDRIRYRCSSGIPEVRGHFEKIITAGDRIHINKNIKSKNSSAVPREAEKGFTLKVFATKRTDPIFVDDDGCFKLGEFYVDCRDEKQNIAAADIFMKCGGTEFEIFARNRSTKKQTKAIFSFLE